MGFGALKEGTNKPTKGKGKLKATTSSQKLVDENANRVELRVYNTGASVVYLALGEAASAEEGIPLAKETGKELIANYSGPVYCVAASGEPLLTYVEI